MINGTRALLCALAVTVCLGRAYGIECYLCNSYHNPDCEDVSKLEQFKMKCDDAPEYKNTTQALTLCRKIIQTVEVVYEAAKNEAARRVIRQCGWLDSQYTGKCYKRSGYGGKQEVCTCTGKYCNSTINNRPQLAVLFATFILAMLPFKFL